MVRHILLVVVDCLRADHVSAYGYHRSTTPTIDRLARDGYRWTRAYSSSSWTKPSVASIFTGRYPSGHGVFRGVKRRRASEAFATDALSEAIPTLAESLANAGRQCGAFLNNVQVGSFTSIGRGFDPFISDAGKADRILDRFTQWFKEQSHGPTFTYLHFLEAHWPYKPRRRHVSMFGGDRDHNRFSDFRGREYARLKRELKHGDRRLDRDELDDMILMYDAAVRRLDGKIKTLLRFLDDREVLEQCAIFVTADHGEELLDHGLIGHGHALSEALTHVPLVARVPGRGASGLRHEPVTLVDLMPTILDVAGVEPETSGRSLIADRPTGGPVFAELVTGRRYSQAIWSGHWKLLRQFKMTRSDDDASGTSCLRPEHIKKSAETIDRALYDLHTDPSERTNLFEDARYAAERDACVGQLDEWWDSVGNEAGQHGGVEVAVDEQVLVRLRELGYIE